MKKIVLLFLLILLCSAKAKPTPLYGKLIPIGAFLFGPFISATGSFIGITKAVEAFKEKKWTNTLKYFGVTAAAEGTCATLSAIQLHFFHNKAPICIKELLLLIAFYHLIGCGTWLIGILLDKLDNHNNPHNPPEIDVSEILKKHVVPFLKEKNLYDKSCDILQNTIIPAFSGR